jgi:hypothetical protein
VSVGLWDNKREMLNISVKIIGYEFLLLLISEQLIRRKNLIFGAPDRNEFCWYLFLPYGFQAAACHLAAA